jgi:DNA repair protein RecO (recombination protein O)
MSELLRQDGVVLDLRPYGESDLIITVLLKEDGLRRFFVRAARRSQKRFGGLLDRFAVLEFFYRSKAEGLWLLSEVNEAAGFQARLMDGLRQRLEPFAFLGLLAEVIMAFAWEEMPAARLYQLWLAVLESLSQGQEVMPLAEEALRECLVDFGYGSEDRKSFQEMIDFIQQTLQRPLKSAAFFYTLVL